MCFMHMFTCVRLRTFGLACNTDATGYDSLPARHACASACRFVHAAGGLRVKETQGTDALDTALCYGAAAS